MIIEKFKKKRKYDPREEERKKKKDRLKSKDKWKQTRGKTKARRTQVSKGFVNKRELDKYDKNNEDALFGEGLD